MVRSSIFYFILFIFLGVLFDLDAELVSLPQQKLQDLRVLTGKFWSIRSCRAKDLASLLGKFGWASCFVKQGRAFLRRLYDALGDNARFPSRHVHLTAGARADISLWYDFLEGTVGSVSRPFRYPSVVVYFETDAAGGDGVGSSGFGLVHGNEWSYGFFTDACEEAVICVKELFAVFLCTLVWPDKMANHRVVLFATTKAYVVRFGRAPQRIGFA